MIGSVDEFFIYKDSMLIASAIFKLTALVAPPVF